MSLLNKLLKIPAKDFQIDSVRYLLKHKYFILADDMGLGKTVSAIGGAVWLRKRTLIIVPAYLKFNWAEEFEKFLPDNFSYKICKNKNDLDIDFPYDIILINYELIAHAEKLFLWAEFLAVDESHYLKSLVSKRTGHFHNFLFDHPPEYLMLMTGTPIKNSVDELYSLLSLCSYGLDNLNGKSIVDDYPTSADFDNMFVKKVMVRGYEKIVGGKNEELLKTYLDGKFLRRTKEEILDLPEAINKDIVVSYKEDKELQEAWDNFNMGSGKGIQAKANSALLKSTFTAKYCKDLKQSTDSPIVIFTCHVEACKAIAKALDCPHITGATPVEERHRLKNLFQEGKLDFLVCTIGSMSTGHTLTRSHQMVLNDISWIPADNVQAMDRIRRMGQKSMCIYHFICGSKTDKNLVRLTRMKMKNIRKVIS